MEILWLVPLAALWLSYSNGANDNFKGVATLYGSNTTSFRKALWWSTATTFAGSAASIFLAKNLILTFSGKGLVSDSLMASPAFATAVGLGAAATVFLATRFGMPTSTTHALIGALLGTGLVAGTEIGFRVLLYKFAIPMLLSPLLAIVLAGGAYFAFSSLKKKTGLREESCICVGEGIPKADCLPEGAVALSAVPGLKLSVGTVPECKLHGQDAIAGVQASPFLDSLHFLSAGAVCFSRALNDTPKIAALLLTSAFLPTAYGIALIGVAMVLGGIIQSKAVAETMSKKITPLNAGQGFAANLTTAGLVLFASRLGVPVSTTHVSTGSILGIGLKEKSCRWDTIRNILTTWVTTLPLAAVVSGLIYLLLAQ